MRRRGGEDLQLCEGQRAESPEAREGAAPTFANVVMAVGAYAEGPVFGGRTDRRGGD